MRQSYITAVSFLAIVSGSLTFGNPIIQPLTGDQKQITLNLFQSASLATAAVESFDSSMVPGQPAGQDPISQKWVHMTSLLQASVQSHACVVTNAEFTDSNGNVVSQSFNLNGSGCQVNYDAENHNSTTGTGSNNNRYQSVDPAYSALNDVDSQSSAINETLTQGSTSFVFSAQGSGSLHSQLLGNLSYSLTGSGSFDPNGNGTLTVTLDSQMPGFPMELKIVDQSTASTSATTYYLNGVALTADEVNTYINLPFAPQPKSGVKKYLQFVR